MHFSHNWQSRQSFTSSLRWSIEISLLWKILIQQWNFRKEKNIINKTRNGARNGGGFNKHVLFTWAKEKKHIFLLGFIVCFYRWWEGECRGGGCGWVDDSKMRYHLCNPFWICRYTSMIMFEAEFCNSICVSVRL